MKKLIIGFAFVLSMVAVSALALNINAESTTTTGNANEEVNSIFEEFYNDGYYVKDTQIYVDENKVGDELTNYFHAGYSGHLSLNRTTYYEGDELYFSYGSGYGTEIVEVDGETKTVLTRFTMTENGKENEYAVPSLPGMEEYYCTLHDFVVGLHNSDHSENQDLVLNEDWQLNGNVYSSSSTGVLEAYRLFTAPTWLGKTQDNANYISFSKATAEVVGETLVMKLWVSATETHPEGGKLVQTAENDGKDAVFSVAVIAKDKEGNLTPELTVPCAACIQVLVESEKRGKSQIAIIIGSATKVVTVDSVENLIPFSFGK